MIDDDSIHGKGLDGTIFAECHRQYTAFCSTCSHQDILWEPSLLLAKKDLRRCGWTTRRGMWTCGHCNDRKNRS